MDLPFAALLLSFLLPLVRSSCVDDASVLASAFASVANFHPPECAATDPITSLRFASQNLTGTVSWTLLRGIPSLRYVDLSSNSLHGSVPSGFWSSPSLRHVSLANNHLGGTLRFAPSRTLTTLNVSRNRLTGFASASGLSALRWLDASRNVLTLVPPGLDELRSLRRLDLSYNSMGVDLSIEFRDIRELKFLNVSYNNFTGNVDDKLLKKFGRSAFIKAGSITFGTSSTSKKKGHGFLVFIVIACVVVGLMAIIGIVGCVVKRMRRINGMEWKEEERGVKAAEEVPTWVAEAKWTAPVVVFEKPLMELRFSDLAAATSGFGKESMLAEGRRSGPAYRAVLPGEMDVVVRVAVGAREVGEDEAAAEFREMAKLRHPNLLPLLGYCIAGREKLLLYQYMERGDLHRWLHELPTGHPDIEDFSADTWDPHHITDRRPTSSTAVGTMSEDWPTRHRVALGIARGLAFLHQGWVGSAGRPVVHGNLVPSNVLLGDNLEPRIADFATYGDSEGARGTPEGDVYAYGMLMMELVTGRGRRTAEEVEKIRKMVREGKGEEVVDWRIGAEVDGSGRKWEEEMLECLRVAYLCTAQSPEKRPTMQQVVGLVKDIHPSTTSFSSAATTTSTSSCNYN